MLMSNPNKLANNNVIRRGVTLGAMSAALLAANGLKPPSAEAAGERHKPVAIKVLERAAEQRLQDHRGPTFVNGILVLRTKASTGGTEANDGATGGAMYPGNTPGFITKSYVYEPIIVDRYSKSGKVRMPIDVLDLENNPGRFAAGSIVRKAGHPKVKLHVLDDKKAELFLNLKTATPDTLVQRVDFPETNFGELDYDNPNVISHGGSTPLLTPDQHPDIFVAYEYKPQK